MFLYKLTDAFDQAGLKYAVVGGFALGLHGIIRATVDVDFVMKLNLDSFELAEKVLAQLGLQSRLPIRAQDLIKMRKEYIKNRNLLAWSFVDPKNPINQVDILITKNLSQLKTQTVSLGGRKIVVATLEELLRMKTAAGRPQDLLDIAMIEEKLNEKKSKKS